MVATPIGNFEDLSLRGIDILNSVELILAEDKRKSALLLNNFSIKTKMHSFHEFSDEGEIIKYINLLKDGKNLALISDAGSPLISDPGFELVQASKEADIKISPIPGPSSVISSLVASGLKVNKFIFEGFPPRKPLELKKYLNKFLYEERTVIFFESPRRIKKLVKSVLEVLGEDRRVALAKEISKSHENFYLGNAKDLLEKIENDKNLEKGEIVFLLEGTNNIEILPDNLEDKLVTNLKGLLPLRTISKIVSKVSKLSSREIYSKYNKK
ncbi:16S rRNA (cytidine(1402)-2'-O)-methyltransferase [SAR86 cluster bacterium]|nr:16S rRNA (cytidine(1402)-2'-O)-methyltransferase [SAR86 cluster bacterium]